MKLVEALRIVQGNPAGGAESRAVYLACGFTPLHLQTFLLAHLRQLYPRHRVSVQTGIFGDCLGNLERLPESGLTGVALVIEWADLDSRLGLRQLGGWGPGNHADILGNVRSRLERFFELIVEHSGRYSLALCPPTLPLPPVSFQPRRQAGAFELELFESLGAFCARAARKRGVRVVNLQTLHEKSPVTARRDVKSELATGFPYRLPHASHVAATLARLLDAPAPRKGLITDLDDTLWRGVLGDVGTEGITWDLDHHSLIHGLYQQLLQSLAETGVLVAVASKNDPGLVEQALEREDLLIKSQLFYPVEVNWGPKSESVARVLRAWNVGAESVVFVDDSPMELAEVKSAFPDMECLRFPALDDQAAYELLATLRDFFGKETILAEDALRAQSLRQSGPRFENVQIPGSSADRFLEEAEAELVLDYTKESNDPRVLELVNKTNQFNLNGRRYTEGKWRGYLRAADTFLVRASYQDKYGPLGTIAVLAGRRLAQGLFVEVWVMSCRAFSRRIEHRCLEQLFEKMEVEEIGFDFQPTPRNGPLRDFFAELLDELPEGGFQLARQRFARRCPNLFQRLKILPDG